MTDAQRIAQIEAKLVDVELRLATVEKWIKEEDSLGIDIPDPPK